jgi:Fe-S oxidoreductase
MSRDILLWRGCVYRKQLGDELKSMVRILQRIDSDFTVVEETCCGYPLHLIGYVDALKETAERNVKEIGDFHLIITPCPACLRCFSEIYKNMGFEMPRTIHLSGFLAEKVDEGRLRPEMLNRLDMKVLYHDPCELGRGIGVYDEPRRLLGMMPGISLYEPRFSRETSACCGGGGLLPALSPSIASMVAVRKLFQEDNIPRDLRAVVTACPQCLINLRRGVEMWGERDVRVLDIAQLIENALGG